MFDSKSLDFLIKFSLKNGFYFKNPNRSHKWELRSESFLSIVAHLQTERVNVAKILAWVC
jgi:hypothetical protein